MGSTAREEWEQTVSDVDQGAVTGKVVHFDTNRGFGFLAPDDGGADVFLHVNDVNIDEALLKPGAEVEFAVEATDRGSKAVNLRVLAEAPADAGGFGGGRDRSDRGDRRDRGNDRGNDRGDRHHDRGERRGRPGRGGQLDRSAFTEELTEILLNTSGSLTAAQVVGLRRNITDFAVQQGWVD